MVRQRCKTTTSFQSLPAELLTEILRYLPRGDIKGISNTSKSVSEASTQLLWRIPKFNNILQPQALQQLRSKPIRYLDVNDFELKLLADFEALAEQLELMPNVGLHLSYHKILRTIFFVDEALKLISEFISFIELLR